MLLTYHSVPFPGTSTTIFVPRSQSYFKMLYGAGVYRAYILSAKSHYGCVDEPRRIDFTY